MAIVASEEERLGQEEQGIFLRGWGPGVSTNEGAWGMIGASLGSFLWAVAPRSGRPAGRRRQVLADLPLRSARSAFGKRSCGGSLVGIREIPAGAGAAEERAFASTQMKEDVP